MCYDYLNIYKKTISCNKCFEHNFLLVFLFFSSFTPIVIILSSWIIAKFIYLPHLLKVKNEKELELYEDNKEQVPYEKKYPLSLTKDNNKEFKTEINYVFETTPDGAVFLKYDKDNESFNWWSDNKQLAYKYLETVARKYVKIFKCNDFYIDRDEDIKKQIEEEKEKEENMNMVQEDKKNEYDSDDELFVKFKPNEKLVSNKKGEKVALNANKYKYCGKIKDFKMLQKIEKKEKVKLDFNSWKNMLSGIQQINNK